MKLVKHRVFYLKGHAAAVNDLIFHSTPRVPCSHGSTEAVTTLIAISKDMMTKHIILAHRSL